MKISTVTSFSTPESLKTILDKHYPEVTPLYYTPKKECNIIYEHISFNSKINKRFVITHFDDESLRSEQNMILDGAFQQFYGMNFIEAMAAIGIETETTVL